MSKTNEKKKHAKHAKKSIICISSTVFIFSWLAWNVFIAQKEFSKIENKDYRNNAPISKAKLYLQKAPKTEKSSGFVILGMHRSGTSMLAGLLVRGCEYTIGDNIMEAQADNPKGFFERWDIVIQNDLWFQHQQMNWDSDSLLLDFNPIKTFEVIGDDVEKHLSPGQRSLNFMNDPKNSPWLVKDPRLCMTLTIWLELLQESPAILYTYRHPMEVARSIVSRKLKQSHKNEQQKDILMVKSLRLWVVYNQRAIENSNHLCRVITYHGDLIKEPLQEINRISQELTTKCKVPIPPKPIQQEAVDYFFDKSLIHNSEKAVENVSSCMMEYTTADKKTKELKHYKDAIQVYCDLKNGKAYQSDYDWPDVSVPLSEQEKVPIKNPVNNKVVNTRASHTHYEYKNQAKRLKGPPEAVLKSGFRYKPNIDKTRIKKRDMYKRKDMIMDG